MINEFDEIDVADIKPSFELLTKRLSALERNAFNNEASTVATAAAVSAGVSSSQLSPDVDATISKKIHSFVDSLSNVRKKFRAC